MGWSWGKKLDSGLKCDMQIFTGLNKQPSKLQLQRGWRWGRTRLPPICFHSRCIVKISGFVQRVLWADISHPHASPQRNPADNQHVPLFSHI